VINNGICSKLALTTIVNGPGQNFDASISNILNKFSDYDLSAKDIAYSLECTCTISGSVSGRPFVVNIDLHASSLRAFAPSP